MARVYEEIDASLGSWIAQQPMFFVATAPSVGGHVNVSPKGPIESFRILDGRTVEYDDHIGSGAETAAHVRENGRICVMFCAFDGPPRILRLHGAGTILQSRDGTVADGVRGVIRVDVLRVADACGFGVPLMDYVGERSQRSAWVAQRGEGRLLAYMQERNASSIDGLSAFSGVAVQTSTGSTRLDQGEPPGPAPDRKGRAR